MIAKNQKVSGGTFSDLFLLIKSVSLKKMLEGSSCFPVLLVIYILYITTVAVSYSHMITICRLPSQIPMSKVNG